MKYLTFQGDVRDTETDPVGWLIAGLRRITYTHAQHDFIAFNGPGAVARFARAVRVRLRKDGQAPRGRVAAMLAVIDPPPCRCGRPGTRVIGAVTFCRHCGPTSTAAGGARHHQAIADRKSGAIEQFVHARDVVSKAQIASHSTRKAMTARKAGHA
jgi:hypothetical protein